jgi:hypothetical protein
MHRLILSLVVCLSTAALADLTLVTENVSQGKTQTLTLSAKGSKAYFEMKQADGMTRTMLRDSDAKKMFLIDHPKKTVLVLTEEESKAIEEKQAMFREQMKAQLAKMPPEQRARMEATMLGAMTGEEPKVPVFTFEKSKSAARKVNGFSCQDYAMKRDGKAYGEGCFMTWKDAGMTAEDFKNTMLRAMPTAATVGPMAHAFEQQTNAPGFPVYRKVTDEQGTVMSESTLKTLSKTAMDAANFELPKGYEEKSMSSAMQRPAPKP